MRWAQEQAEDILANLKYKLMKTDLFDIEMQKFVQKLPGNF